VSVDHILLKLIHPMVDELVETMKYLANPTLLLECDGSTKVVEMIQSSSNPTLFLRSDVSIDHIFNISILEPS
jgi:hypothetical protein